jgi:hypothetical protein
MAEFHHLNVNFNGGELTPLMNGRVDFDGYRSGCVQMENFMVRPYGGAFKVPGTQYLGEVKNSSKKVRLVPLKISRTENYILEVGEGYIRFFKEGTPARLRLRFGYSVPAWSAGVNRVKGQVVTDAGITYVCIKSHYSNVNPGFSANWYALQTVAFFNLSDMTDWSGILMEWPNSYTEAELATLQWRQIGRSVIITQGNHPPLIVESVSTASNNPFITAAAWSDANSTEPNYSFMVGELSFTFPPLTEHPLSSTGPTVTAAANTVANNFTAWATATSYALSTTNPVIRVSREMPYTCILAHTSSATSEPLVGATWTTYWRPSQARDLGQNTGYYLTASSGTITTAPAFNDVFIIEGTVTSVSLALSSTGALTPTPGRFHQGGFTVSTEWASGAAPIGTLYLYQSFDGGLTWDKINEWLTASATSGTILYTDTAPVEGAWYRLGANITTGSANAKAKIEPNDATVKIPFIKTSPAGSSGYAPLIAGGGMLPNDCLGFAATTFYEQSFSSTNGYPSAIGIHNLRLWLGGTAREPNKVRASCVDDLFNFATGDQDSDGLDITLNSSESNCVRWIASFKQGVVIGTDGEEWTIQGAGDGSEVLKPTNIQAIQRNRSGSKDLSAIQTRDSLLWVSLTGRKVFEFAYVFSTDDYKSPDMTLRAEHITESGIIDMVFQNEPDPVLWCVLANGKLLGFSYNRESQIAAWFKRTTSGGEFEAIATVRGENDADCVWTVVKRTINGSTKRYIERFYPTAQKFDYSSPTDLCYLDCSKKITLSGSTVNGLTYLQGKSVTARIDGKTTETHTVSGGTITLSYPAATSLFVGLPIASVLQPEPIEQVLRDGTAQGRRFNAERIHLLLNSSIGGTISNDPDLIGDAIGYPTFSQTPATSPAALIIDFTGAVAGENIAVSLTLKDTEGDTTSLGWDMAATDPGGGANWINTTSLANAAAYAAALSTALASVLPSGFSRSVVGNTVRITTTATGLLAELSGSIDDYTAAQTCAVTGGGNGGGSGPITPFTGRLDEHIQPEWKDAMTLTFKHSDPTPFNLLGFVLKAEISGS